MAEDPPPEVMTPAAGRYVPVSRFRRLVADLMHFSARVPSATVERRMALAGLATARRACAGADLVGRLRQGLRLGGGTDPDACALLT